MDLIEYIRGLRDRWRVIAAATLIGLVAAFLTSLAIVDDTGAQDQDPGTQFEASVQVLDLRGPQTSTSSGSVVAVPTETLPVLVPIEDVAKRAAKELEVDADLTELASTVQALIDDRSATLTITATADQAREAERTAEAFANGLSDYLVDQRNSQINSEIAVLRKQLKNLSGNRSDASARLGVQGQINSLSADLAAPLGLLILEGEPGEEIESTGIGGPTSQTARLLVGLIVGVLGGIVIALLLERLDRRIRTRQAAEHALTLPLLAEIPTIRGSRRRVDVAVRPLSAGSDAFRILASAVLHAMKARWVHSDGNGHSPLPPSITIAVTSSERAEGKSLVSANLAGALGELGLTVIVISCDLRRPTLHRFFDVPPTPGVSDVLQAWDGRAGLDGIRQATNVPNVTVLPSGRPTERPAAVLAAEEMRDLLKLAGQEADVVILDTPALLLSGDAASLLPRADGVLLVARVGKISVDSAERVSETLENLGAPTIGFVLNGMRRPPTGWRRQSYRSSAPVASGKQREGRLDAPSQPTAEAAERS